MRGEAAALSACPYKPTDLSILLETSTLMNIPQSRIAWLLASIIFPRSMLDMLRNTVHAAVLWLSLSGGVNCLFHSHKHDQCRYIPGDKSFPGKNDWNKLNETVSGRLIGTVPAATICHGDDYGEQLCNNLKKEWDLPQPQSVHIRLLNAGRVLITDRESSIYESAEIMSPYWQNQSCDPFTARETPCNLRNYVSYSINVTGPDDIRAGIDFVKQHNIRPVIKNTGHEYVMQLKYAF